MKNDEREEFPFEKVGSLPDIVSKETLKALEENLQKLGISVPPDVKCLSVRAAIQIILTYQGIKLADLGKVLVAQEAAARKLLDL